MKPVIGLEVHVQLATRTKMFCGCAADHGGAPNSRVCPVCLGLPGALPVPNARAVQLALRAAELLGCDVHAVSRFTRKNYFYPDLPKGYQITQVGEPLATGGMVTLENGRRIDIRRAHIEEDAAKLLHSHLDGRTAIDLNRCGIPLLEIVTEPVIESGAEAAAFGRALKQLLQYAGVSDCDMELGSLRIDANVSLAAAPAPLAAAPAPVRAGRTELKNLNSFAQLERAINAEIERQRALQARGEEIASETIAWDAQQGALRVMRQKEQPGEYRYFDEPDLPPLHVTAVMRADARLGMPELPGARVARYASAYSLPESAAHVLTATRPLADYFDAVVAAGAPARAAAAWIQKDVLAWCNAHTTDITHYPVAPQHLAELLSRADRRDLAPAAARALLHALESGAPDVAGAEALAGLPEAPDEREIESVVQTLVAEEAEFTAQYRAGDARIFGHMMGLLMTRLGGAADAAAAARVLRRALEG